METLITIWEVSVVIYIAFVLLGCRQLLSMKYAVLILVVQSIFAPVTLIWMGSQVLKGIYKETV